MKQLLLLLVTICSLSTITTKADEKVIIPALIYSKYKAEIFSEENGILIKVKDVGESFQKGDALLVLENDYQKKKLNSLLSQKKNIENKLDKLTKQATTYKRLAERGTVSKDSAIEKDIGVLNARIELANIQQRILELRFTLSRKTIYAPFSGVVSDKLINQYSSVTSGMHVITILDKNLLFVKAKLPADMVNNLGRYNVFLKAGTVESGVLELDYVSPEIHAKTNTVEVSYRVSNMDLVVGQSVFIEFRK